MQILKSLQNLPSIEGHIILHTFVHLLDLIQKGASFHVLELKIQILLILERAIYLYDKRTGVAVEPKLEPLKLALALTLLLELG